MYLLSICVLVVTVCSCNGNINRQLTEDKELNSAVDSDSIEAIVFTDPLFFIEGQLCQHVRTIFEDSHGNLWFGTNVYGLMMFDGDTLAYFTKKDGLGAGRITDIVEDKIGNVWFTSYEGLSKYDGQIFTTFTVEDGLLEDESWCLTFDRNNIMWIGTNAGISTFDGQTFSNFPFPKAAVTDTNTYYAADRVTSILEDRNGYIWIGTDGFGITKYDNRSVDKSRSERFSHFTKSDGLCDDVIYDLMEDSNGNIWIGTMYGGISMFDGKSFHNFTTDAVIDGVEAGAFFEDEYHNIWFAAENFGVYRYDGKTFINYYTESGLVTNGILSIYKDSKNRFWFGGWGGLFRFDEQALLAGHAAFQPVTKDGPWN